MKKTWILLLALALPLAGFAQNNGSGKNNSGQYPSANVPSWAKTHNYDSTAHVYFPDYYTFYDPRRGGYLYWENGKWSFSPSVPPFLEKVDMSKSRIQILKGISLDLQPELNYPYYMKMYPPDPNGNSYVPVPGNPAGR